MTKLLLTMAAGSVLLLVSCEPIPHHAHRSKRIHKETKRPDAEQNQEDTQPQIVVPPTRDQYPVAERTANPNHVISPYAPYNVINVEGFRTGQLAKDPSNQKIFRIP